VNAANPYGVDFEKLKEILEKNKDCPLHDNQFYILCGIALD